MQRTENNDTVASPAVNVAEIYHGNTPTLVIQRLGEMWWAAGMLVMFCIGASSLIAMRLINLYADTVLGTLDNLTMGMLWVFSLLFGFVLGIYPFGMLRSAANTLMLGCGSGFATFFVTIIALSNKHL